MPSEFKGNTDRSEALAAEMFARGLSVRDIEGVTRGEDGLLPLRSGVLETGEQRCEDYQTRKSFAPRGWVRCGNAK